MTVKQISTIVPAYFPPADSAKTVILGNQLRTVTPLQADPLDLKLAEKFKLPTLTAPKAPASGAEEMLREIGRKTFYYKNSLAPAETVNWKQNTNRELEIFVQKTSIFSIIYLMDSNIDSTVALEIVNEACSTNNSPLNIYMKKAGCQKSFFHRLHARLSYFVFFKCGLLPNTLNTFMQKFLDILRTELVQKQGGKNVTTLIHTLLSETSSFLDFYQQATENYTNGINLQGSRDVHINWELTRKFGMTQDEICRRFTHTVVRNFLPKVQFFSTFTNSSWRIIKIIGSLFDITFGWVLNRGLKKLIEKKIPAVFQSIVKTGIDATQPDNLPFRVSITQGILEQLRKFKSQLEQKQDSPPEAPTSVTGTEKLPEVVKKLITILNKDSLQTRKELQHHSGESGSFIYKEIDKRIEESCIDGCREFFSYLSDPVNSEEIFSLLLNLTNITFESTPPSTHEEKIKLGEKFEALKKQMQREAREVFQMVIHRSVNERVHGLSKSQSKHMMKHFEALQRSRSFNAVGNLLLNDQSIQAKIAAAQQDASKEYRIVEELDKMNDAIDSYHSQEVLDDLQKFPSSIQEGTKRAILPVLSRMNALLDQITYAKKLHKHHQEKVFHYHELQKLGATLRNPDNFRITEYKKSLRYLRSVNGCMESEHAAFDSCLSELDATYQNLATESQILESLVSLTRKEKGPLPKLYHAVKARTTVKSAFYRWKSLPAIPEIPNLDDTEHKALRASIQALVACKDQSHLNEKWGELKETLTQIYRTHRHRQIKLLNKNSQSIQQYLQGIEIVMGALHSKLTESIDAISNTIQSIAQKSSEIRIRKIESIPNKLVSAFGGPYVTIGAVAGASLSAAAAFLPGIISYPILGAASVVASVAPWYFGENKLSIINGAAGIALGATTHCFPGMSPVIPLLASAAGGAAEGGHLEKAIPSYVSNEKVFPQVRDIFDHLYEFILKPHVWKWAIVDSLKCVNDAFKE